MKNILLFIFLIFIIVNVNAVEYQEISIIEGYTKINVQGNEAYILDNIKGADQLLAVDKYFYGSSNGSVNIKIYLSDHFTPTSKKYKIGIRTKSKDIIVKRVKFDTQDVLIKNPRATKDFIYSTKFDISSDLHEIEIELEFDPEEIGLLEKFDVILYDEFENIDLILDPFLSGRDERYSWNVPATTGEIIKDKSTIEITFDTSTWNCSDNNQMAVGWNHDGIAEEIDADIIAGTCGSGDINVNFKSPISNPANTSFNSTDSNGVFFYSTSSPISNPKRNKENVYSLFEDWEDNSIAGYTTTCGNWATVSDQAHTGTYSVKDTASFGGCDFYKDIDEFSVIQSWVRRSGAHGTWGNSISIIGDESTNVFGMGSKDDPNVFLLYINGSRTIMTPNVTFPDETWIKYFVRRNFSTNDANYFAFSTDGTTKLTSQINESLADADPVVRFLLSHGVNEPAWFDDLTAWLGVDGYPNGYTLGAKEELLLDFNVTFNVFQGTGSQADLNNFNIDFNVDAYDQIDVNSPITVNDINAGTYLITISKDTWTDGNTFELIVDANTSITKTIDKFVYPKIFQFERNTPFASSSKTYLTVETFQYDINSGTDVNVDVSCAFWSATTNSTIANVFYLLQSSEDGVIWTNRRQESRSFNPTTTAGSIYIVTDNFQVPDGNNFFRLQQRQQSTGALFNVTTDGLVCHLITELDQNNNAIIKTFSDLQDSTTSPVYESVNFSNVFNPNFNSIFYGYGSLSYSQAVSDATCNLKFEIPQSNFVSEEFPRTTSAGSIGVGGLASFLPDLNANGFFDVNVLMKTSAGTCTIDRRFHLMQLNQKTEQFAKIDLNGTTTALTEYTQLGTVKLTNEDVTADYRAFSSNSFSCSEDDCLLELFLNAKNGSYDVNSLVMPRETNGAGSIGISILQYDFNNVSTPDFNVSIWGKTDKGIITFEGGVTTIIRNTLGTTSLPNPPQIPQIILPVNGSDVNGSVVDYNCFSTDPNLDPLTYDVNVIFRDTNNLALNLESAGTGNGDFNSFVLANGTYSIDCTATEISDNNFSSSFDNSSYSFTITNPIIAKPPKVISSSCKIELSDDEGVTENEGIYYFNTNIIDSNTLTTRLNPTITLFNQKYNLTIFSKKTMTEALTGNYVYSTELFLENGRYSFLVNVDGNCSKSFTFEINDSPEVFNFGTKFIRPKTINTSSGFDIWGFIANNTLILILAVLVLIGGVIYFKKK